MLLQVLYMIIAIAAWYVLSELGSCPLSSQSFQVLPTR